MGKINPSPWTYLTRARSIAGYTRYALADRLHISHSHLSRLELGTRKASVALLHKIAHELNVPVTDLIDTAPEPPSQPVRAGIVTTPR